MKRSGLAFKHIVVGLVHRLKHGTHRFQFSMIPFLPEFVSDDKNEERDDNGFKEHGSTNSASFLSVCPVGLSGEQSQTLPGFPVHA